MIWDCLPLVPGAGRTAASLASPAWAQITVAAPGWAQVVNGLTDVAYVSIAAMLLYYRRRLSDDAAFRKLLVILAIILLGCAVVRGFALMGGWSDGIPFGNALQAFAAIVGTAVVIWWGRLASQRPTTAELARVNRELKASNAALRSSEDAFRTFMDNSPLRCWITDTNGTYHYSNLPNDQQMAVAGGVCGKKMHEIFPAELATQFLEADRALLRAGTLPLVPFGVKVNGRELQIHKFPVHASDGQVMVGSMALDVTDVREANTNLQQKTELLAAASEALRVYLDKGDWKTAHGVLLRCALKQTQSEYGFIGVVIDGSRLRILAHEGMNWEEHLSPELYKQAVRDQAQHGYVEFTNLDNLFGVVIKTGSVVLTNRPAADAILQAAEPMHLVAKSFLGVPIKRGADVIGMIAVANRHGNYESAHQNQLEALGHQAAVLCDSYHRSLHVASLEEQVRVAQKMEAVGLLAGGVAHDFNNLLQVIQGYTAIAIDSMTAPPERRSSLDQVRAAGERAAQLTQQLLAFGRQQTLQKIDLDLNVVIQQLLRMIRRVIGEQITVDFIPGHELGNVNADQAQMDQVLLNLCLNSRDAMPNGGRITIETENVLVNGSFRESHPWAKPGRYVLVTVSDNGCGMDRETVARIFEPFFTTKPKEKGTGLGLAVVYGVVKQHEGMIHVYSEPGKGTTFKIYVPIVTRSAASIGPKHAPPPGTGTETVLLAEDEQMVRELAQRILSKAGYRVLIAKDGAEACALFALHAQEISLVILDVVMPQLGGRDTYERLVRQRPGIPVIFCSGYAGSALSADALGNSGAKLLAKPYGADELLGCVRTVLDNR
jgi:signal transduction histidine kinase